MCKITQEVSGQKHKGQMKMSNVNVCSDQRLGVRLIAEEGYGNLFRRKDQNSGLTSGLSILKMFPCIMG
jgi:hypothetical protein